MKADPPGATLDTPGSVRVSALLMQDAVTAQAPDVKMRGDGGIDGRVALFANPFLNGQEEALAINDASQLTHLRRAATGTGWEQVLVTMPAEHGHHSPAGRTAAAVPVPGSQVVVVVHPKDLSVWAICAQGPDAKSGPPLRAFRLVADVEDGVTTSRWDYVPGAISYDPNNQAVVSFSAMSVTYDYGRVCITGVGTTANYIMLLVIVPRFSGPSTFYCGGQAAPVNGTIYELTARCPRRPGSQAPVSTSQPVVYLRWPGGLYWYDTSTGKGVSTGKNVRQIIGSYPDPVTGGVGCLALGPTGALQAIFPRPDVPGDFGVWTADDVTLATAASWMDVNGMIHVYGIDASGALKVVHQASWGYGYPVWAQQPGVIPPSPDPVPVTSCVGLAPAVSAFALDPFPDTFPSQLVRTGIAPQDADFAFLTQDINSARWSRDQVRMSVDAAPHLVTRYVASATVLDRRGVAMPGLPVRVSAETPAEVRIDGVSHLVGPGSAAVVSTNAHGKVVISMPADSLAPPVLHVDAAGLRNGAVIQPAAAVHSYLGGVGTLPSQQGRFTVDALKAAAVDGVPIILPGHAGGAEAVVYGAQQVFKLADGKPLTSLLPHGKGPGSPIHGFAVGPRPGAKPNAHGVVVPEYREFTTADEYADYHRQVFGEVVELGGWQEFATWAGDVWQGIKNGAITIARVVIEATRGAVDVFFKIGAATVKLAGLIVDTAEAAARVVESYFRQVVADVGKVVDWLASLFDFEDVWQTKTALTQGTRDVLSYGLATVKHYETVGKTWVADQLLAADKYYDTLRADYANRPVGDARNQVPLITDGSGASLPPGAIRDDPRGGWLTQQAVSPAALAAFRAAGVPAEVPAVFGTIAGAWDAFLTDVVGTGVVEKATRLIGDLDALVASITDPADPAGSSKASMVALIDCLQSLTELGLTTVKGLLAAITTLVQTVVDGLDSLFSDPLPGLGYLETLYKWIQGQSGVAADAVEPPSLGGLLMLMAAFPVTVGYKLVNGVDEVPFPDGRFPTLPAPSWHADYDTERTAAAGSDPAENRRLRNLQIACGVAGLASAGPGMVADLLPLASVDEKIAFYVDLITGVDTTALGAFMFGAIGSCPPVTGTDWDAAGGKWAVAFEVSVITVVANIATIAKAIWDYTHPVRKPDTSILRNVQLEMAGPVITTFLALAYLIPSGQACTDEEAPVNPYTTAMILLSGISGATQICRLGLGDETTADAIRGGVVAAVNYLATGISASMLTAGAKLAGPVIDPRQQLPAAHLGQPYEATLTAEGGTRVFDKPLKGWSVVAGALPDGLTLDPVSGTITGTPTRAMDAKFTVQCTDSYGPPQFSNVPELRILVH